MRTNSDAKLKTLGTQSARLLAALSQPSRCIFTLPEVGQITGLKDTSARSFMRKLVNRGVAARLHSGVFILVPFELGSEREYLGNPYVVAREFLRGKSYYVSNASAMDIHGMVTQPQLTVYVTSPVALRSRTVFGTEFRFVRCKPSHLFGITEQWVEKHEKVAVSDIERTILDGLRHSEYCGGVTEVAKGLWMRRDDIDIERLVDYALRLDVGAVIRRLGYLIETYGIEAGDQIERLRSTLTATYLLVDPLLPPEGKYLARWRLRLNVSPEELHAVVGT